METENSTTPYEINGLARGENLHTTYTDAPCPHCGHPETAEEHMSDGSALVRCTACHRVVQVRS